MKKNIKRKVWVVVGVLIASILLLWWLYAATLINEDVNELTMVLVNQINLRT